MAPENPHPLRLEWIGRGLAHRKTIYPAKSHLKRADHRQRPLPASSPSHARAITIPRKLTLDSGDAPNHAKTRPNIGLPWKSSLSVRVVSRNHSPSGKRTSNRRPKCLFQPPPQSLTYTRVIELTSYPVYGAYSGNSSRKVSLLAYRSGSPHPESPHIVSRYRSRTFPNPITDSSRGGSPRLP